MPIDKVKDEDLSSAFFYPQFPNFHLGTCYLCGKDEDSRRTHSLLKHVMWANTVLGIVQNTEKDKCVLSSYTPAFLF